MLFLFISSWLPFLQFNFILHVPAQTMDSHNDSDSSSDEGQEVDTQPLKVDWLVKPHYKCEAVGLIWILSFLLRYSCGMSLLIMCRMNLSSYECTANLGITSLPGWFTIREISLQFWSPAHLLLHHLFAGCRFKDTWRNLKVDIGQFTNLRSLPPSIHLVLIFFCA